MTWPSGEKPIPSCVISMEDFFVSYFGLSGFEYDAAYTLVLKIPPLVEEVLPARNYWVTGRTRSPVLEGSLLTGRGWAGPFTLERPLPPGQWLLKPRDSGGGIGITWAREGNQLPAGYLLQEFQDGIPASVSFLADGRDAVILGMSEQLIGWGEFGARGFAYCGNIVPLWREHWKQGGIPFSYSRNGQAPDQKWPGASTARLSGDPT